MRTGYILLHRQGLTPEEWKNPERTLAWIDFLTLANYDDGIVTASYGFLAKRWRKSKGTIHFWIKHWITERQIERLTERSTERNAERFFIVRYAEYQKLTERVTERSTERSTERQAELRYKVSSNKSEVLNQEKPKEKIENNDELRQRYSEAAEACGCCDHHYVEKLWVQGLQLPAENRTEFLRKATLLVTWAKLPKHQNKVMSLHGEIAGYVNDKHFFPQP